MNVGNEDFGVGAPLMLGSVFGHRVWEFEGGFLTSPSYAFAWDADVMEAKCTYPGLFQQRLKNHKVRDFILDGSEYKGYDIQPNGDIHVRWRAEVSGVTDLPDEDEQHPLVKLDIKECSYVNSWSGNVRRWWEINGYTILNNPGMRNAFYEALTTERSPNEHMDLCSCGFYAYFRGQRNLFHDENTPVIGVIEGFGETLIGEKGFRCRKARIVALAPYSSSRKRLDRHQRRMIRIRLKEAYPEIPVFRSSKAMYRKFPLSRAKEFK